MMESAKPRKQRKRTKDAPLHKRQKRIAARLNKKLSEEYKKRSASIRKDDKVKVMRGKNKGKEGKVTGIDLKRYKITVDGIIRKKPDGKEIGVAIAPSNVMITELNLSDEKRKKSLERKM